MSRVTRRVSALLCCILLTVGLALPATAADSADSRASVAEIANSVWSWLVSIVKEDPEPQSFECDDSDPDCELGPVVEPNG